MADAAYLIRPRDPILVRDGRPFSADPGARAETLPWPLPSTLAGAMRTHIGNTVQPPFPWDRNGPKRALGIGAKGPLLVRRENGRWRVYLSAPADAVVFRGSSRELRIMKLLPRKSLGNAGCNNPDGLAPLMVTDDSKPERGYDYWSIEDTIRWLCGGDELPDRYLGNLDREARVHVKIDPAKSAAETGMLFATVSICFPDLPLLPKEKRYLMEPEDDPEKEDKRKKDIEAATVRELAMLCRVYGNEDFSRCGSGLLLFGGERRVAFVEEAEAAWPGFPDELRNCKDIGKRLKLQLVTPALFDGGWKPGWLADQAKLPPCLHGLKLKLISAAIHRRVPVSGWDMHKKQPKAARYAAPAGSVYFFEVEEGAVDAEKLWLESVCDKEQDRLDGFGLVIPGTWDYAKEGN